MKAMFLIELRIATFSQFHILPLLCVLNAAKRTFKSDLIMQAADLQLAQIASWPKCIAGTLIGFHNGGRLRSVGSQFIGSLSQTCN